MTPDEMRAAFAALHQARARSTPAVPPPTPPAPARSAVRELPSGGWDRWVIHELRAALTAGWDVVLVRIAQEEAARDRELQTDARFSDHHRARCALIRDLKSLHHQRHS
jgi:hypothetical protein